MSLFHFKVSATRWSVSNLNPDNTAGSSDLHLTSAVTSGDCSDRNTDCTFKTVDIRFTHFFPQGEPGAAVTFTFHSRHENTESHHVEQLNRRLEVGRTPENNI